MTLSVSLADTSTQDDLRVFLERLAQAGKPEVRLVVQGTVLGVFGCTQAPESLTDSSDAVLVSRAFQLQSLSDGQLDVTVAVRSLLDRLARRAGAEPSIDLPENVVSAAWAGVLPPREGWQAAGVIDAASLSRVAKEGAARIADALPDQPGEALLRKVRQQVWGVDIAPNVPAAAAFAADSMGFLQNETRVLMGLSRGWVRLESTRGQVLVRRQFSLR